MGKLLLLTFGVEYLNRLHADQINDIQKKDLCCWSCGGAFKKGDLLVIRKHTTKRGGGTNTLIIKRHAKCAILKNVITPHELAELKKTYKTFGNSVFLIFFAAYALNVMHVIRGIL